MALPDQLVGAPIESLSDLDAEPGHTPANVAVMPQTCCDQREEPGPLT
jgi:hypothetical protein